MTMISKGIFGNYVRLSKGWNKVLENDKSLVAETKKYAGRIKTSYVDPSTGELAGTITQASDGRIITKVPVNTGRTYFNTPAEEVIRSMGIEMTPKTSSQKNLQSRIFHTARCDTLRLNKGCESEVIKPNGESTQYFYHRGVVAKGYEDYPQNVLESPFDVSGKLTYLGGDGSCYGEWLLQDARITNQDTGLSKNLKNRKYTEWAVD